MKITKFIMLAWAFSQIFMIAACDEPNKASPQLLFSSGFEDGVYIGKTIEDYKFIQGTDSETGFSWPISVLGASESALHCIANDKGKAISAKIETLIGHDGKKTRALYSVENYEAKDYTQCPYEILNITEGKSDLYLRFWIKLDKASLHKPNMWRTFFEWKTKDYAENTGFRLISFIYTDDDAKPYWHWQGDIDPEHAVWEIDNKDIPVPENEWFLTEFYWHWSENDDGRALWKINGEVVGDHYGPTTRNSKAIDFIMLAQIYGDANPKHQWVDDIEIWDSLPPE
ncbi:MAG TPA: hypothetical protein ENK21_01565 [Trueperaceae bacterium]|nr:hypothetical protein [Trueperaceae bacterium]